MKLKYFGHLVRRKDSLEKSLMLRTIDGKRRRGRQRMRWLVGVSEAVAVEKNQISRIREEVLGMQSREERLSPEFLRARPSEYS
ncbi:tRNA-specific 2-thiouridylase MnmA [Varanus komodoensis]|nr:tRNA-specific 2-thiouridylase MnmA [Varanus komodoensis]